ncbi:MAG: phosphatase PAP2 family protein [Ruminococcaceae bacterium]|nr:phosphatase PAP2 family protein [Oscillospiraceae bacterium]
MEFLYFLESLRNPVLDFLFSVITVCGEETIFMAVGMIFFWCVNKHQGYYLFCVGFFGTVLNQFLKMAFRIPRPWVKDPNFTIVESAKEAATGYSFPSGHTQTSVGLFGGIAVQNRNRILRGIMIALCVLVPLSRLYLGVHTPLDVGVSIGIALILIFVAYPIFRRAEQNPRVMYAVMLVLTAMVTAFLIFVSCYSFPAEVYGADQVHNLQSAQKNAYTLLGCMIGLILLYTVERKWIRFDTHAVWWAQILKVSIGLVLVLAVKEVLRAPLDTLFGGHLIARSVRYCCVVITGGVLWPLSFRFFAKLR